MHTFELLPPVPNVDADGPPSDPPPPLRPTGEPAAPLSVLRHRAEVPLLWLCGFLTLAGATVAVGTLAVGGTPPGWSLIALVGLVMPLVAATVGIRWTYWRQITRSVEVTADQLPDLHRLHIDLCAQMGLAEVPRLYVANGNGLLNAMAAKCQVGRGYVVIFSDLVDIAYEHDDWSTIEFVLAHELAHIRCGHVALWRTGITALPRLLWLDRSLTRAQEYTADRVAARHVPHGTVGMLALYAGKRLHRHVDPAAYLASIAAHRDGFWLRLVNLTSTHPVGFRRMATLAAMGERGWDVHGRML